MMRVDVVFSVGGEDRARSPPEKIRAVSNTAAGSATSPFDIQELNFGRESKFSSPASTRAGVYSVPLKKQDRELSGRRFHRHRRREARLQPVSRSGADPLADYQLSIRRS